MKKNNINLMQSEKQIKTNKQMDKQTNKNIHRKRKAGHDTILSYNPKFIVKIFNKYGKPQYCLGDSQTNFNI